MPAADCVSALVAEGRYNLFVNRIAQAKQSFPSDCFESNGLCGMFLSSTDEALEKRALAKLANPFIEYNVDVLMQAPDQLLPLLLFENYRFGLGKRKYNTLTIERRGHLLEEYKHPLITIGRLDSNRVCLADNNASRRHCVIVNFPDDVWVYDTGSTHGVFVDGEKINRKAYLHGVHVLRLGDTELTVCSRLGLLV